MFKTPWYEQNQRHTQEKRPEKRKKERKKKKQRRRGSYLVRACRCPGPSQELHCSIHRSVLRLELRSSQPDLLRFRDSLERLGELHSGARNIVMKPALLGSHEPKVLGSRTVLDGFREQCLEVVANSGGKISWIVMRKDNETSSKVSPGPLNNTSLIANPAWQRLFPGFRSKDKTEDKST